MKKVFLAFGLATVLFVACSKSDNDQPQPDNGKKPVAEELNLPKKIVEKINDTIAVVETYTFDGKKIVSSTFQEYEDGASKDDPRITTYTYQGDYIIKSVSVVGGNNDSTTEYTYENGKLVKIEMIDEELDGLSDTYTYAYSGDKLSKKVRAYYRNSNKNTIYYSEYVYTYNGNVVTETKERYKRVNNGNKEDVDISTSVYTIQNGNLVKKEENEGEYTFISEYTYDTNKNPLYADFALAMNPDYFIELQFTTNNVLTELVSKKNNDTGVVTIEKKATSTYQYNAHGYPTKEEIIITEGDTGKITIEYEY